MGVARQHLIAVVHLNHVSIVGLHLLGHHYTACCREHRGAHWRWKIQTLVQGAHAGKRVDAPAKTRTGADLRHRHLRGNHQFLDLLLEQARLNRCHQVVAGTGIDLDMAHDGLQLLQIHVAPGHQRAAAPGRVTHLRRIQTRQA